MDKEEWFNSVVENKYQQELLDTFLKTESLVSSNKPIVLVTSGGTIAPLEKRLVRYIDNFSTGNRGAGAAESFLEHDCHVIFLYRKGSCCPYQRFFPKDCLETIQTWSIEQNHLSDGGKLMVPLEKLSKAVEQTRILFISFQTVTEYLQTLRQIVVSLKPFGKRVILFLAAAVSDFYVPDSELPEHKISQSYEDWQTSQPYLLKLYPVPKCLGLLKSKWAPDAYLVSFKLETDIHILLEKAKKAIDKYGVDIVVANELTSRYESVQLVTKQQVIEKYSSEFQTMEQVIVEHILEMHQQNLLR